VTDETERTERVERAERAERGDRTERTERAENRPQPKNEKVRTVYLWFLGVAGGVFLALFVLSLQWKDSRKIARIDVAGTEIFAEKTIVARAKVPQGALIDTVSLAGVRARLVSHPYIRDARVSRVYPDALRIEVDERVPVASFTVRGAVRYVDAEGVVLPYLESAVTHDLPSITGVPELLAAGIGEAVGAESYFEALSVLSAALGTDSSLYHLISEVDMKGGDDVVIYDAEGGATIKLGRGDTMRKMILLRAFWDKFVRDAGPENLEYLDLRFGDRVVAKWINKPPKPVNLSSM
jgi:cell division septal protein FtsQ